MRNDIFRRGAGSAQILAARAVNQRLRTGIGVNSGHGPHLYTKGVMEHFRHRRQAVGGARGHGNNRIVGVQRVVVNVIDNGFHVASGRGDQHFFSPGGQMRLRFLRGGIKTRTLDNQLGAYRFPRNMLSLFFRINGNFFAINDQRIFRKIHAPWERTVV